MFRCLGFGVCGCLCFWILEDLGGGGNGGWRFGDWVLGCLGAENRQGVLVVRRLGPVKFFESMCLEGLKIWVFEHLGGMGVGYLVMS